ncbi:polyphosphate kinase 2 family protein [Pedobacter xixiisoli]|uniref:Polyphosphate:nucleotide phosphotransferase, PPK2 family n=1 Tax=Pedobacter xixiisoli TaxID=1476464 RepID=A0A285ZRR6_9SPHI|nr:polyphosphate kinase 2 family protein [Pedobacter xixiisoli]SOD12338.1 polyphosphate:nucleotide phosphotransferase, PPK2 family [Pedobacter xixiisoli]
MKTNTDKYLVKSDKKVKIKDFDTDYNGHLDKEAGKQELDAVKEELSEFQEVLYASNTHSVLVLFQAMDAAGKDGAIAHVMSGLNPQGCQVYSFKTPSSEEYDHDFLWRHYKALPEKGRIGIHNRSHYENVLVCKVHPEYIMSENLPNYSSVDKIDKGFWKNRYESIRNFEKHLTANGVTILKFFLNVSKDEQKKRFLDRIEDPTKNWKFSSSDIKERALWDKYMDAYEDVLNETSTDYAPWYVIPADKKWYTRLAVSQIIAETLKGLKLEYPVLVQEEADKLAEYKKQLLEEK